MAVESTNIRESLEQDLEAARSQFIGLLDSLTEADWKRKSAIPAWTVGQLMWHLSWALGLVPRGVAGLKKERGFSPPGFITHPLNSLISRFGGRRATPAQVKEKYERAHLAALATLRDVKDDEWQRGAKVLDEYRTVETAFRAMREHVEEHAAHIRQGLGRAG